MSSQLIALEAEMKKVNAPVLPLLNQGLKEIEILNQLKKIKIVLPQEAHDIYKWHNGTKFRQDRLNSGQSLFFGTLFPNLQVAVENYIFYSKSDRDFKKTYFSLFETPQGVMYLIDCDKTSVNYGMILQHDISRAISPKVINTIYDSVSCFVETITQCYKTGVYSITPKESELVLSSDYRSEVRLSKELNPKSAYWKYFEM